MTWPVSTSTTTSSPDPPHRPRRVPPGDSRSSTGRATSSARDTGTGTVHTWPPCRSRTANAWSFSL
ncbi:hypothetical protein [Thermocatellispora tengchongensis]|uniref:hypothetical protein n=1 Tax=Thermocatellispora tengchongensis TaxID=1073253 RepID=UPI00363C1815